MSFDCTHLLAGWSPSSATGSSPVQERTPNSCSVIAAQPPSHPIFILLDYMNAPTNPFQESPRLYTYGERPAFIIQIRRTTPFLDVSPPLSALIFIQLHSSRTPKKTEINIREVSTTLWMEKLFMGTNNDRQDLT